MDDQYAPQDFLHAKPIRSGAVRREAAQLPSTLGPGHVTHAAQPFRGAALQREPHSGVPILLVLLPARFHLNRLRQRRQRRCRLQLRQFLLRQPLHISREPERILPANLDLLLTASSTSPSPRSSPPQSSNSPI